MRRRLARLACRALLAMLPPSLRPWGHAIAEEVAAVANDGEALRFALSGFAALAPRGLAVLVNHPFAALTSSKRPTMPRLADAARHPRALGIACGVGAVLLGLAYLTIAGAPVRYGVLNAAACAAGLAMLAVGSRLPTLRQVPGALMLAAALALLATALLGTQVEGAARWIRVGGLMVQPSLILLPAMIVGFARVRTPLSVTAMLVSAAAMALQPDRAMAGMQAAGALASALTRPGRDGWLVAGASLAAFAVTLVRPDALGASAFVDQILWTAFAVHPAAGIAVLAGTALLLLPTVIGLSADADHRATYAAFGCAWSAAILAAALSNSPTPVVGYGGSAVLGYLLSLGLFPRVARPLSLAGSVPATEGSGAEPLRLATA